MRQCSAVMDDYYSIWTNRYVAGRGWGMAQLLETDDGPAGSPQISMDADGNAFAIWEQSDGTRSNIIARRFE